MTRLVLPIELTNGNEGRTKHWGTAAKRRREYAATISPLAGKVPPAITPVVMTITRVLGPRQQLMDVDSLGRGNAKELIDAIVAVGILPDDGPKHVLEVRFVQDSGRRHEGPSTEVLLEPVS